LREAARLTTRSRWPAGGERGRHGLVVDQAQQSLGTVHRREFLGRSWHRSAVPLRIIAEAIPHRTDPAPVQALAATILFSNRPKTLMFTFSRSDPSKRPAGLGGLDESRLRSARPTPNVSSQCSVHLSISSPEEQDNSSRARVCRTAKAAAGVRGRGRSPSNTLFDWHVGHQHADAPLRMIKEHGDITAGSDRGALPLGGRLNQRHWVFDSLQHHAARRIGLVQEATDSDRQRLPMAGPGFPAWLRARSSRKAATHARGAFQLIATSLVEYDSMWST
jgi:hypothetical protein